MSYYVKFKLNNIKKQATATGRVDKQRLDRFSKQLVSKMIIALIILKINKFTF